MAACLPGKIGLSHCAGQGLSQALTAALLLCPYLLLQRFRLPPGLISLLVGGLQGAAERLHLGLAGTQLQGRGKNRATYGC